MSVSPLLNSSNRVPGPNSSTPIYRYAKLRHGPTETQGGQVALKLKSGDNSFDRSPGLDQLSTAIGIPQSVQVRADELIE